MSLFEGTRFEKLESSIKNELSRKRKHVDSSSADGKRSKSFTTKPKSSKPPIENTRQITAQKVIKTVKPKSSTASAAVPAPPGSEGYINDKTIYIQGLPFAATEEDVRSFFKEVGEIESIRLPKWHDSGKLKGYGHVEFKRVDSATKALDLNGEYLMDRYLTIDRPMVPRALTNAEPYEPSAKPAGCRTIFIKNLPYETSEAEITEQFKVYGPIKNVRLAVWNHTGKLKGIGYIDFKREDSAETAVKKTGTIALQGRKVIVDYETGAPKGSFKPKTTSNSTHNK